VRESTIKQFGDTDIAFDIATSLFDEATFVEEYSNMSSLD